MPPVTMGFTSLVGVQLIFTIALLSAADSIMKYSIELTPFKGAVNDADVGLGFLYWAVHNAGPAGSICVDEILSLLPST